MANLIIDLILQVAFHLKFLFYPKSFDIKKIAQPIGNHSIHKNNLILLFFQKWKFEFIQDFLPDYNLFILGKRNYNKSVFSILMKMGFKIAIWGYNERFKFPGYFDQYNNVLRIEDGFIRSIQLGCMHSKPFSLTIDPIGLYYNANKASLLENILNYHEFEESELKLAQSYIAAIQKDGISKYNHAPEIDLESKFAKNHRKKILVIGQVDDDASIVLGCDRKITSYDLIAIAKKENPDAEIIYKAYPDVLAGKRGHKKRIDHILPDCTLVDFNIAPVSIFKLVDKVYTITSLMGFEALLHGKEVICVCAPFYSNWGITDDRQVVPRRQRKRNVEEIFCASYMVYPKYPY